jgi:tetratricopeptide (TPR) repeat protein
MLLLDMDRLDEGMIYYRNLAAKYPGRPVIAEALSDLGTFKAMQEETSPKKICLQKIEENVNDRTSQSCVREAFEKENAQANYYLFISDFVKRHPDSYAGWFQLGYSLKFHRQEPEAAMAAFANALRLKPDYATPYYQMAHSYLLKKDYQKAAELMKMAAKVDPEFSFEAEKYQYLALEYGAKYPEALSYIRERQKNPDFKSCLPGAKAPPPDSDEEAKRPYLCMQYHFWNTAEISLMGKTDPEQAKILCLNALEHNPDEVRGVGTCYNLFPDWNARTKERSLAADNNDSNPSEFKNRETCNTPQATQLIKEFNKLTAEEQVIKGRELLNQALKLDPKCYPAHAARAYKFPLSPSFKNYFGQERYDQGVRELCESAEFLVSEDSWDLMADFALGTCYDLRGEYMKGVLLYQSLLEKFPDDPFCEDVCTPKLISFHSALGNCEAVNSLIPQVMAHRPGFSWTNLKHLEKCRPDLAKPASAPGGESGPKP